MKRNSLFFIGLVSAIVTIISLNVVLGRPGYYYERYPFYNRYHHCDDMYDERYPGDKNYRNERQQKTDSSGSNY